MISRISGALADTRRKTPCRVPSLAVTSWILSMLEDEPSAELNAWIEPVVAIVHGSLGPDVEAQPHVDHPPRHPVRQIELVTASRKQAKAHEATAVLVSRESGADGG